MLTVSSSPHKLVFQHFFVMADDREEHASKGKNQNLDVVKGITDVRSPNDLLLLLKSRWKCLYIREISGATGDLGTFLPLLLNMATVGNGSILNFSSALFWAGVANIVTGMIWDSPIPVQPMKTIAAVAITEDLTGNEMIGAGLSVSIVVFLLGQTGLIETINYLTPISIVRGLQLGLGITMAVKGIDLMTELPFAKESDSILLTIACLAFTLLALSLRIKKKKYIPAALVLVVVGLLIAIVRTVVNGNVQGRPGVFVKLTVSDLTFHDLLNGFWKAGFAQLPLTTLNSVVSICDLNNENYFKNDASKKMTRRSVARSVGLMNLLTLPFGSIPMCTSSFKNLQSLSFTTVFPGQVTERVDSQHNINSVLEEVPQLYFWVL